MRIRSAGRWITASVAVALFACGCGAGGPIGPTASAAGTRATPELTAPPTSAPTTGATLGSTTSPPPASAEPPAATLTVEGGDAVVGQLGSFTWGDSGSDSPWLPGVPIGVGAGEPLTVAIADGVAVAEWTARRVPAGTENGMGAVGLGEGGAAIAFPAPPGGTWSVQVAVQFAAGLGSATYYWQVTVR